jgi:hypothetical protein
MRVLCDTCSVIMLLRIAPEMLLDPRFECVTLQAVYRELRQQPRFKTKYPWLAGYLPKVRGLRQTEVETVEYKRTLDVVRITRDTKRSSRDNRRFGLSQTDMEIAAAVVTHKHDISTVERDLEEFLEQEFDVANVHPLALVNDWIEKDLILWGEAEHRVLEDWVTQNERRQPLLEIQRFEKLAKRKYPRR